MKAIGILLTSLMCCSSYHRMQHPTRVRCRRVTTILQLSTQELLRETMELKNVSSIFLLNATRFGLDLALADGLKSLGDYEEAEKFAIEAIEIAQQTNQSDNIYAAYAERILGEVLFAEEKYREAAERFRHSLQSYVSHYNSKTGPKNLEAIGSSQIVSYVLMKSEQFDEAIKTLTMELDKAKEVYGSESIQAAETMTNLATVHFYKNDFDKAEECYKTALHMYQAMHQSVRTAHEKQPLRVICTGLGDISYIRKDVESALQWYLEVERMFYESDNQADSIEYVSAMKNLAMIHWQQGSLQKAEQLFNFIMFVLKSDPKYGEDHPQTKVIAEYLKKLYIMEDP